MQILLKALTAQFIVTITTASAKMNAHTTALSPQIIPSQLENTTTLPWLEKPSLSIKWLKVDASLHCTIVDHSTSLVSSSYRTTILYMISKTIKSGLEKSETLILDLISLYKMYQTIQMSQPILTTMKLRRRLLLLFLL